VDWSPDGNLIAYVLEETVTVLSSAGWGQKYQHPFPNKIQAICFADDSTIIAASYQKLFVWRLLAGSNPVSVDAHESNISCLSVSREGGLVVSGGPEKVIKVWKIAGVGGNQLPAE
jgi:WD40 repeat protein